MSLVVLGRLTKNSIRLTRSFRKYSNIVKSALPIVDIPDVTIPEYVFQNFDRFPKKIAVECGITGKSFTYDQVRQNSHNFGKSLLKKLKLKKGDSVILLLPNVPEFAICVLGAIQGGLTVSPINPLYSPDEIKRQLLDSDAKVIITLTNLWPLADAAVKLTSSKIPIITIKNQENESLPNGAINFKEFIESNLDSVVFPKLDTESVVLMPYSSGTTGLPKGVELTNHNIVSNLCQMNEPYLRLAIDTTDTHQDVVPAILPMFHIYGITTIMLNHLYHMCKLVTLPKFTPELYISMLVKHKPEVLFIVPPIVSFMTNHPAVKKEYFDSIRTIMSGAAPLGGTDEENFLQKAQKPINMLQGYGMTETSPCVLFTSPIRKNELGFLGSVGEPVSRTEVKIVPVNDINGKPLGPNETGELFIKGPQVMKQYHNRPDETKEAFVDGWLRTGDMVYYDENKMFYVTDRLKELIKVKGFQVAPAELEAIIRSHPKVSDAAVIGIPDERDGEVPKAFVITKPNSKLDGSELQSFVDGKVASFKKLRGGIKFVEIIPKTASGKIMRKELREQHDNESH